MPESRSYTVERVIRQKVTGAANEEEALLTASLELPVAGYTIHKGSTPAAFSRRSHVEEGRVVQTVITETTPGV